MQIDKMVDLSVKFWYTMVLSSIKSILHIAVLLVHRGRGFFFTIAKYMAPKKNGGESCRVKTASIISVQDRAD